MKMELKPYAREINSALRGDMRRFQELSVEILILGEDVCRPAGKDGAFNITSGLPEEFPGRVKNTILNESTIIGVGAGMAMRGARVVIEMQFADFVTDGYKMIVNYIAGIYYRNGIGLSIVIRLPSGATGSAGPFHSTCPEMLFFREPGLLILSPATPYDAKGLLRSAIRQDTPTIFIEWKRLYGMPEYPKELDFEIPDEDYTVPIGKARMVRTGNDITIVSYGVMLLEALGGCNILREKGISAELIDLRSLMPFDHEAVSASVKKTGRLIVAHEDKEVGGYGAAFIQLMSQRFGLFDYFDAEPLVVGAKFTPHPHNPVLEREYLPNAEDVVKAAEKMFGEKIYAVSPVSTSAGTAQALPVEKVDDGPGSELIPISVGQKIIAEILTRQWQRPHIHSDAEVNFRNIKIEIDLGKEKLAKETGVNLTYTPFIAYAVSRVLMRKRFRKLRAYFEETIKEKGKIDWAHPKGIKEIRDFVNISIAVAIESDDPEKDDGLLVPVVKNAHELSFVDMAKKISELAEKCRGGKLLPDEQKDGVITITNVGIYGVLRGNPILTETKQMASIAVGEIKKNVGILTLAFDHRMINGMLAGRFLQALKEYLENWEGIDIFKD